MMLLASLALLASTFGYMCESRDMDHAAHLSGAHISRLVGHSICVSMSIMLIHLDSWGHHTTLFYVSYAHLISTSG